MPSQLTIMVGLDACWPWAPQHHSRKPHLTLRSLPSSIVTARVLAMWWRNPRRVGHLRCLAVHLQTPVSCRRPCSRPLHQLQHRCPPPAPPADWPWGPPCRYLVVPVGCRRATEEGGRCIHASRVCVFSVCKFPRWDRVGDWELGLGTRYSVGGNWGLGLGLGWH